MNNEEIIESVKTNIVNRLSSNSSSSRYQGCIISHQSIIGHKRRPMLVIDAKFMGDETVRITALPITSTPFSCDEGFAIIFNNTISIALFAPETIEMGCSELKRYQKNRLAPTEFVDCINCLHKFLIHDPSISTYLLERLLNFSKITEIYNKSNHYSSDNSVGIKLGEKIPNIQPIENEHNKTKPKVVKYEEKPKTTKSKLINKDDDKYKSPNVKTFKEAVNLLEILSRYDSIKGCWKLRYFGHAYVTFYDKVQKAITIIETEVKKNPDIRLNNSIKSVMSEFKVKKRK
jgi:hypothetical protein